jgi:hypothetical protein
MSVIALFNSSHHSWSIFNHLNGATVLVSLVLMVSLVFTLSSVKQDQPYSTPVALYWKGQPLACDQALLDEQQKRFWNLVNLQMFISDFGIDTPTGVQSLSFVQSNRQTSSIALLDLLTCNEQNSSY